MARRVVRRSVTAWSADGVARKQDSLAAEEPLEIRVDGTSLTVTMRTPGDDVDLALGFLVAEGVLRSTEDVVQARFCDGTDESGLNTYNVLDVRLSPSAAAVRPVRHVLTSSACGLCGRTSVDEVRTVAPYDLRTDQAGWGIGELAGLPDVLRTRQQVFSSTGGLHAAGVFSEGDLVVVREDVGRHNAVDRCVGWALREGRLPLRSTVLVVSGRASFELVQKAVVAGIPALVAVSAPSSLAVDLAVEAGLTLVGFARGDRAVVYAGAERVSGL